MPIIPVGEEEEEKSLIVSSRARSGTERKKVWDEKKEAGRNGSE